MIDLNSSFKAWSLTRTIEFLISCNTNTNNIVIVFDDDLLKLLLVINNIFIKYSNNNDDDDSSNISVTIVIDDRYVHIVNNYISIVTNHINEIGIVTTSTQIIVSSTIPCDANHVIFINSIDKCWDSKAIPLCDTITTTSLHAIDTNTTNTSYETTINCIVSDVNITITRSINNEINKKMITSLALSIVAFKDSLASCIDYCHIFPALVPIPLRKNNSKLVFEGSSGGKTTAATTAAITPVDATSTINSDRINVWTVPGPSSSLDYLISLLRASKHSVHIYVSMILLLKEKALFVRNCALSRQLEVVEALELVFFNGLAYELSSSTLDRPVPSTSSSTLIFAQVVSEISRFIVGIDSHNDKTNNLKMRVLQIARSALLISPMNVEINLVLARCLLISSPSPSNLLEAQEVYIRVLNITNENAEAKAGLEEVAKALSNINDNNSSTDKNDNAATSFKKLNLWMKMAYMTKKKANIDSGYKLIENDIKLSESIIWEMQRNFYARMGLEAWNRGDERVDEGGDERKNDVVPFYITSNSKIAMEYSRIFYSALVDLHIKDKLKLDEPLYIVELGSGCAKFSLLFVRFLKLLLQNSDLKLTIIHIISDFTEVNFEDISNYNDIKPFLLPTDCTSFKEEASRSNVFIDFAVFDGDKDSDIKLLRSKQTLSSTSPTANPIFVVANYIFDSLVMDAYKVVHSPTSDSIAKTTLNEGRLTLFLKETDNKTSIDDLTSMDIKRCNLLWSYNNKLNPDDSRHNAKMNHILDIFSNSLSPGIAFTVPVGGLFCLDKIKALTSSGILVTLLADKAYNRIELLEEHDEDPAIAQHGSLSMMVNLVAAGAYTKIEVESSNNNSVIKNGFTKHSPQRNSPLDVALFCSGIQSLPLCELSFEMGFCDIGINDVFVMRDHCEDVIISKRGNNMNAHENGDDNTDVNQIDIVTICCLGHMCSWDSDMIFQFGKAIQYNVKNFETIDENRKGLLKQSFNYLKTALKLIELGIIDQFDVKKESKLGLKEILQSLEEYNNRLI